MSIDAHLAKVAAEKGIEPLSAALKVSVEDASAFCDQVTQQAYFEELAKLGRVAKTQEQADQLLAIGDMVGRKLAAAEYNNPQQQFDDTLYKVAADQLSMSLGEDNPTATAAYQSDAVDSAEKIAELTMDPSVITHMVALHDANNILAS